MTIASCKGLCVKSGEEAIKLIIYSQRIFQDFKMGQLMIGEDEYKTKLILREFNHNIDFEYEFRCFVFKNKITAITQYNSMIYLHKIVKNKQKIQEGMKRFWRKNIAECMMENGISSYVMDLAMLKKENKENDDNDDEKKGDDEFEFILIEMNPFCTNAGAMLFEWKEDVKILTNQPLEFRILENVYSEKPEKLTSELNELFDELYNDMNKD